MIFSFNREATLLISKLAINVTQIRTDQTIHNIGKQYMNNSTCNMFNIITQFDMNNTYMK